MRFARDGRSGLMFVGYNIGAGLGGFIAAWTIKDYGWSAVFFIGGLAAIPMFCRAYCWRCRKSVRFLIVSGGPPKQIAAIVRRLSARDRSWRHNPLRGWRGEPQEFAGELAHGGACRSDDPVVAGVHLQFHRPLFHHAVDADHPHR